MSLAVYFDFVAAGEAFARLVVAFAVFVVVLVLRAVDFAGREEDFVGDFAGLKTRAPRRLGGGWGEGRPKRVPTRKSAGQRPETTPLIVPDDYDNLARGRLLRRVDDDAHAGDEVDAGDIGNATTNGLFLVPQLGRPGCRVDRDRQHTAAK
jgi:hypothetical protein